MTYHTGTRLDLAPLYRHCLLSSQEPQESHMRVAQEFSDHQLTWKRGRVDTVMYRTHARQLSVVMLRYGAEIEIRPQPFDDFALLHVTLQGMAEMDADGQRIALPPGRAALLAPRRDLRMHWEQGAEQLIVKIPGALLRGCGHASAAHGNPLDALAPVTLLPTETQGPWTALLQALLTATTTEGAIGMPGGEGQGASKPSSPHGAEAAPLHAHWVDHIESAVASHLLLHATRAAPPAHQPTARHGMGTTGNATPAPTTSERAAALEQQRLQAMDSYMQRHLGAPVGLEDVARAANVSGRTLHNLCIKHHGMPPMERLRALRLDAVRQHLLRDRHASVTDTALHYGFGHLGRFAAYYRERFGELPSALARQ